MQSRKTPMIVHQQEFGRRFDQGPHEVQVGLVRPRGFVQRGPTGIIPDPTRDLGLLEHILHDRKVTQTTRQMHHAFAVHITTFQTGGMALVELAEACNIALTNGLSDFCGMRGDAFDRDVSKVSFPRFRCEIRREGRILEHLVEHGLGSLLLGGTLGRLVLLALVLSVATAGSATAILAFLGVIVGRLKVGIGLNGLSNASLDVLGGGFCFFRTNMNVFRFTSLEPLLARLAMLALLGWVSVVSGSTRALSTLPKVPKFLFQIIEAFVVFVVVFTHVAVALILRSSGIVFVYLEVAMKVRSVHGRSQRRVGRRGFGLAALASAAAIRQGACRAGIQSTGSFGIFHDRLLLSAVCCLLSVAVGGWCNKGSLSALSTLLYSTVRFCVLIADCVVGWLHQSKTWESL